MQEGLQLQGSGTSRPTLLGLRAMLAPAFRDTLMAGTDTAALYTLANLCPRIDGAVVYQARALLRIITQDISIYADDCPDNGNTEDFHGGEGNQNARIAKQGTEQAYRISPNPNNGTMNVWRDIETDKKVSTRIVNVQGSTVFSSVLSFDANTAKLSVNAIAPGLYSIVFEETSDATYHVSFVKR